MNCFKISKIFLIISVFYVVFVTGSTLFPFIVGKYAWFRSAIDLALVFFLLGLLFQDESSAVGRNLVSVLKQPLVIAVTVFTVIFLLAGFFGADPGMSFWSNFERGEGGFQMIHLWLFFIMLITLFKEEKDWKKILLAVLAGGIVMVFYGVGASLKYVDAEFTVRTGPVGMEFERVLTGEGGPLYQTFKNYIGSSFTQSGFRFSGSIGNPAYVGAFSIFMIFYVLYLLFGEYAKKVKSWQGIALCFLGLVFLTTLWSSGTRGSFIGFLASGAAFAGYYLYAREKWKKWLIAGIIILILAFGSLIYFHDSKLVKSLPGSRIFDISFSVQTLQHRMIMWNVAWDGFKDKPILGWGPENYLKVFAFHFNPDYYVPGQQPYGAWFDRAHSIYFDYLVETGIIGLLGFLAVFAVFYWMFFKFQKRQGKEVGVAVKALFFSLPIGYLVQGLVIFDVLPMYANLFLFLALANYFFNKKETWPR